MRKLILTLLLLLAVFFVLPAQEKSGFGITLTGLPDDYLYPTYMADPLYPRTTLCYQMVQYSEIDFNDPVDGYFYTGVGSRMNFLRISPKSRPDLGIEGDFAYYCPFLMDTSKFDFMGYDGIFFLGLAAKPASWLSLRFVRHHICSHKGDELLARFSADVPLDFNIQNLVNYVRDDFYFSVALTPAEWVTIYGDVAFFMEGEDPILGERLIKPNTWAYMMYQGGIQLEHSFPGKLAKAGGLYTAAHVSFWEENGYAPNISLSAGYLFPQILDWMEKIRIGVNYYDGRPWLHDFYEFHESYFSIEFTFEK